MTKFKKLVWKKLDCWIAPSPAADYFEKTFMIFEEKGEYWTPISVQQEPFDTLEEAQDACQKYHETYLKQFIEE